MNKTWEDILPVKYEVDNGILDLLPDFLREPDSDIFRSDNYLVVDFETDNEDHGSPYNLENELVSAAWKKSNGRTAWKWCNTYTCDSLARAISEADFVVAHNAKFEQGWFQRAGIDISNVLVYCTMVGEKVRLSNRSGGISLDASCERYNLPTKIDIVKYYWNLGVPTRDIPEYILIPYMCRDVDLTERLFLKQRSAIISDGLLPSMFTRCLFTSVLSDIERRGMKLDYDRVMKVWSSTKYKHLEAEAKLKEYMDKYNLRSPDQRATMLYEDLCFKKPSTPWGAIKTTETGKVKTDRETILKLKAETKRQRDFIKWYKQESEAGSMLSKYLDHMKLCVEENDGIMLAEFHQTRAATQRTSCTGKKYKCQLQNIMRLLHPCFVAKGDLCDIDVRDFSQLEWGVGVETFKDGMAVEEIKSGFDMHTQTATHLYGSRFTGATPEKAYTLRRDAKAGTFRPLFYSYGGQGKQKQYAQFFKEKYVELHANQQDLVRTAIKNKKTTCINGTIFYFPNVRFGSGDYVEDGFKVCNYPIQHVASADHALTFIVYLWHFMRALDMNSYIMAMIHDSVLTNLEETEREQYDSLNDSLIKWLPYWFYEKVYGYKWKTPLNIDKWVGHFWDDSPEWREKWLN